MKKTTLYTFLFAMLLPAITAGAQTVERNEQFAVKLNGDFGLGNTLHTDYTLPGVSSTAHTNDFGIDFGWTFWTRNRHSLEANIGVGFQTTSLTANMGALDYHYSAPAEADMDMVPYIRYSEISDLHQKIKDTRVLVPIHIDYRYKINDWVSVNALVGFKFGFNVSSKLSGTAGSIFNYGIYPQYDNLLIDATYMNEFGARSLSNTRSSDPTAAKTTAFLMAGVGAEFRVYGPLSLGINLGYDGAFGNMYKKASGDEEMFTVENAPVTYTVADGQTVAPLTNYLTGSKLSRFSIGVGLIYRF